MRTRELMHTLSAPLNDGQIDSRHQQIPA
jgi:hypothetical protein